MPISLAVVNGRKHTFHLASPIDLRAGWDAGRFVIEYEPLHISVYSKQEEEAYTAFAEMFETVWEQIAEAPDMDLTRDAQELKRQFRRLVRDTSPGGDE
jgi:hypothetical protein